jgi:DNA helicase-2/ATP-dependent DNA helicase PcrA
VLAGAGTGKTRVVTYRIARLIKSGVRPNRILAVTFTNKAAREMQQRVTALLQRNRKEKPEVSTFHSLCVRVLRRHIHRLGYPKQFAIYDRSDQESIARAVLREIRVSDAALRPGDLLSIISSWKSAGLRPHQVRGVATPREQLAALAYPRYQRSLKTMGAVDFDDLLLCTEELFEKFPEVREQEAGRYDHLLIDEYQDTNGSQYRIVKHLARRHRNLCVVGDDDQAIYGWRGAEVTHILNFRKDWPEAKVVRLEANYRSTRQILDWSNRLIAYNKKRHQKRLTSPLEGEPPRIHQAKDGEHEAKMVVEQIRHRIATTKRQPHDFAILFRTNDQPRAFETELRIADLPYVLVGGQSFFDRKEIRDVMAYLKILARPQDESSVLRVINAPPRGIGQTSIQRMTEQAVARGVSMWETMQREEILGHLTAGARKGLQGFQQLVKAFSHDFRQGFSARKVRRFIDAIDYRREIDRQFPEAADRTARWESLGEIVSAAAEYEKRVPEPSLAGFLESTTLAGPDFDSGKESKFDRNAIVLLTLHAAKGLEFKEVFLVGMEEAILPHHRSIDSGDLSAIDEERRLCYVGITRAQRRLTLTLALHRRKWGKMRPTIPSRFLYELTGQADNPNYLNVIRKRLVQQERNEGSSPPKKKTTTTGKAAGGGGKKTPGKKLATRHSGKKGSRKRSSPGGRRKRS